MPDSVAVAAIADYNSTASEMTHDPDSHNQAALQNLHTVVQNQADQAANDSQALTPAEIADQFNLSMQEHVEALVEEIGWAKKAAQTALARV